jgi:hypothetical protein
MTALRSIRCEDDIRQLVKYLSTKVSALEHRCNTLEQMVFYLEPSQVPKNFDSVDGVRDFLRKAKGRELAKHVVTFLCDRLPPDWRLLIRSHGHAIVFECLIKGHNICDARRELA